MAQIALFGKQNCGKCQATKKKLRFFLQKWGYADDTVRMVYHDLDTIEGLAEGAFEDVGDDIPVILVKQQERQVARWEGRAPNSNELQLCIENIVGAATN